MIMRVRKWQATINIIRLIILNESLQVWPRPVLLNHSLFPTVPGSLPASGKHPRLLPGYVESKAVEV